MADRPIPVIGLKESRECPEEGAEPDEAATALRQGTLRAALFFSGETAQQFARLLIRAGLHDAVRGIDACAIGQPAATAIDTLPWRRVLRAAKPTQDAMLALLR